MRKPILATRVAPYVDRSVRRLSRGMGITISEYLRRLILQDLDSRKLFDEELREAIESFDEDLPHKKLSYPPEEISVHDL